MIGYDRPKATQTPPNARKSAVLCLLHEPTESIILIQRPSYDGVHSGQIAFPGGKWEKSDVFPIGTALRETQEEIGVPPSEIELFGELTSVYIPPSNFIVHPLVGKTSYATFQPEAREVESIIHLPISTFLAPSILSTEQITISTGVKYTTPVFKYENRVIWGATAMMLSELRHFIAASL